MTIVKPKGYIRFHERPSCDTCVFCYSNRGYAPTQEVGLFCKKVSPVLEVCGDDCCDEYESIVNAKKNGDSN